MELRLGEFLQYFLVLLSALLVEIADKRSYRAEFKLTRSELFDERSDAGEEDPVVEICQLVRSVDLLPTRIVWGRLTKQPWRSLVRSRPCMQNPRVSLPYVYVGAREVRHGNARPTTCTARFFSYTHIGKLNWPRKADQNGGCDRCGRSLVVLATALIGQRL